MKLRKEFITYSADGQEIMVSTDTQLFSGYVRGNETAGVIIDCLKKETTEDQIVDRLMEEFDGDISVIRNDVEKILLKLKEINAIED